MNLTLPIWEQEIAILENVRTRYDVLDEIFEFRKRPVEEFLNRININDVKYRSPCKGGPFVTRAGFEALLDSAFASPTCRKIELPRSLLKTPYVENLLKRHSYRFLKVDQFGVTYRRYNFI